MSEGGERGKIQAEEKNKFKRLRIKKVRGDRLKVRGKNTHSSYDYFHSSSNLLF